MVLNETEKLAIKLPSQHIFQAEDDKVIDNELDKVEGAKKLPQIISDTQSVYNERVNGVFFSGSSQDDDDLDRGTSQCGVAFLKLIPKYVTRTFTIPKSDKSTLVINVLTGRNIDGQSNIKYSTYGITQKGVVNGSVRVTDTAIATGFKYNNLIMNKLPPEPENVDEGTYVVPTYAEYTYTRTGYTFDPTVSKTLKSIDNILTADVEPSEDGENFITTLTILSGIEILKAGGIGDFVPAPENAVTYILDGEYEEYIPTQVNVSFYGDIIKLDLENNDITIGNGDNVISFNGNELMQDTNSPTIEQIYKKVINRWQDGKENATIKCGIADYYDENDNLAISVDNITLSDITLSGYGEEDLYYECKCDKKVAVGTKLKYSYIPTYGDELEYDYVTVTDSDEDRVMVLAYYDDEFRNLVAQSNTIKVTAQGLPMLFKIGDTVIPYVRGANGIDKPMSKYSNGEAKKFQIVSNNIAYDGAVWQTLELLEASTTPLPDWNDDIPDTAKIFLSEIVEENEDFGYTDIKCTLIKGFLKVGDTVIYNDAYGEVNAISGDTVYLRVPLGNKIQQALGQSIIVTIKE